MGSSRSPAALGVMGMTLGVIACEPQVQSYPAAPACTVNCGSFSGGGVFSAAGAGGAGSSTTTTTSTGTGSTTGTTELTGNVGLIVSPVFDTSSVTIFNGMANIVAPGPSGYVTVPYGGASAGTTFDLMNISSGNQWILVQDTSGGASGVLSTWSEIGLPVPTPVTIPVLDAQILSNIAMTQLTTSVNNVSPNASQVVLLINQGGAPVPHVSMTGSVGGAVVAYDQGPGVYSDTLTETGSGGTIILFNSGFSGPVTLSLVNNVSSQIFQVPIQTGQGAVTFVPLALP